MEHVTKNLTPESSARCSSGSRLTTGSIPPKWIDALLTRFAVIWPRTWASSIEGLDYHVIAEEWAQGLGGLSRENIKRGLDHARDHMPWPPSIAEFRQACQGGANAEQRAYAARAAESVPLLASKTRAETRQAGAESAARVRQVVSDQGAKRTRQDAIKGLWTREREEAFQHDCMRVGAKYPTPDWLYQAWEKAA